MLIVILIFLFFLNVAYGGPQIIFPLWIMDFIVYGISRVAHTDSVSVS